MAEEKKFVPQWKVYTPSDLSKKWFIYYRKDGKRAARIYGDLSQYDNYDDRLAAAHQLIKQQEGDKEERKTLAERMYGFLDDRKGVWRNKSYATYRSKVNVFLTWLNGRKLTVRAVEEFFIHLSDGRHRTTYNTYRRQLKKVLKGIGEKGLFENIDKLTTSETPAKYFQHHQKIKLREYISQHDPELWFFCQFVYYCFLRPCSELRLLRVGDVDLDRNKIQVPGEVSKNWKMQHVTIPVPFRKQVAQQIRHRHASDWLFPGIHDSSKPVGENTYSDRHRKILRTLGFGREYKLYSWKHTGAVACVQAGVNIKELQIQLRHSNLETVDKYLRQLGVHDLHNLENLFPAL